MNLSDGRPTIVRMTDNGETMNTTAPLPADLTDQAPGPQLSSLLAAVDLTSIGGRQLIEVIAAQSKQICFEQARLLAMLHTLARPQGSGEEADGSTVERDPHAASNAAAALAWTEYATTTMLDLAATTVDTAPVLLAEMRAGRLDLAKLKVIRSELAFVEQQTARAVVDDLIAELPRSTTGQLRRLTRQLVIRTAPEAARARCARAIEQRRVRRTTGPQGTVNLSGLNLPKDKAIAAWKNIETRARATAAADRVKRTIDQLRADVFAELLTRVDRNGAPVPTRSAGRADRARRNAPTEAATTTATRDRPGRIRDRSHRRSRGSHRRRSDAIRADRDGGRRRAKVVPKADT